MGTSHQTFGSAVPFFVYDWHLIDLSTAHFDPITDLHDDDYVHPTEMAEQRAIALYEKNGSLRDLTLMVLSMLCHWQGITMPSRGQILS